jgi:hypothetical protein
LKNTNAEKNLIFQSVFLETSWKVEKDVTPTSSWLLRWHLAANSQSEVNSIFGETERKMRSGQPARCWRYTFQTVC